MMLNAVCGMHQRRDHGCGIMSCGAVGKGDKYVSGMGIVKLRGESAPMEKARVRGKRPPQYVAAVAERYAKSGAVLSMRVFRATF